MPLTLLSFEIFDHCNFNFIGLFPSFNGYVAINYDFKLVEAIACRNNDQQIVVKFLKEDILSRFQFPKPL